MPTPVHVGTPGNGASALSEFVSLCVTWSDRCCSVRVTLVHSLWGFLYNVRPCFRFRSLGAVGGAGKPPGSSVLLSPSRPPKKKGASHGPLHPPVKPSGVCSLMFSAVMLQPQTHVSGRVSPLRIGTACPLFEGGGLG